jgi:hypothetical protein
VPLKSIEHVADSDVLRLSVFAQMRLADLATAWLRDDTHETLVSTMPYWEHCPCRGRTKILAIASFCCIMIVYVYYIIIIVIIIIVIIIIFIYIIMLYWLWHVVAQPQVASRF